MSKDKECHLFDSIHLNDNQAQNVKCEKNLKGVRLKFISFYFVGIFGYIYVSRHINEFLKFHVD